MSHGTHNVYGHGFVVTGVPNYLDEACKAAPHHVFKGKASAVKRADAEAISLSGVTCGVHLAGGGFEIIQQVEGVVATQLEGFGDLWFVVYVYTDEMAASTLKHVQFRAECDRRALADKAAFEARYVRQEA